MSPTQDPDLFEILKLISSQELEYVIVGGIAAQVLGAPISTLDIDIVYRRTEENVKKLLQILEQLEAVYRGYEAKAIKPTADKLLGRGHHILITKYGGLDVLAFAGADHEYEDLADHSVIAKDGDVKIRIVNLDMLIQLKQETNRDKDKAVLPILLAMRDELSRKHD